MGRDNRDDKNKIKRRKVSSSDKRNTSQASSKSGKSSSSSSKRKVSRKKSSGRFKGVKTVALVFLVLLVVGVAAVSGIVFASLRNTDTINKAYVDKKTFQTTEILYADGHLLAKAQTSNKKEPVDNIKDIDKDLQHALISAEDERFYEHNGVDMKGLARSVVNTLMGNKQGGSTIPMQVSKMLITSQERSVTRKIKDIYYAFEMSKTMSKEDILLAYLNNFYAGNGLYGAEAAAQGYFSISAKDLTPGQAALLMASTNNPSKYSPYIKEKLDGSETKEDVENKLLFYTNTTEDTWDEPSEVELQMIQKIYSWQLIDYETYTQLINKTIVVRKAVPREAAKEKQKAILSKMLRLGYITQEQYDKEAATPIEIKLPKAKETVVSSVEDYVYSEVVEALMNQGYTKEEAQNMYYNGGLRISTTIDAGMQKNLETQYDNKSNFPETRKGADGVVQPQSAMVILDYRTGQIKSLIGGRYVKGKRTLNRATNPEQPGSTIKPLSVYTPAIDTKKTTQSRAFSDARGGYEFEKNQKWNPKTTTAGSGIMSARKALAWSSNTVAVKVGETLGNSYDESIDVMIDYLKNFGITTVKDSKTDKDTDRQFPSLVLGGMSYGISPLEMAAAYGTLANGGNYIEPTVFTTIQTYDGNLIAKSNPQENRAVSEDVAFVVTDMLQAVVKEGTGKNAAIDNMAVAGKTGTTNDALDAWFVGYTPYYVGATYIGDDAGTGKARQSVVGTSSSAASLWSSVMTPIHKNLTPVESFTKPEGVYFAKINPVDGGTSSYGVNAAFLEGTSPQRASTQAPPVQEKQPAEEKPNTDAGAGDNPPDDGNTEKPVEPTPPEDTGGNNGGNDNGGNNNGGGNEDNSGDKPVDKPVDNTTENTDKVN
ncbi:transglycosylase domain-containing protein [Terrisporobacter mayombei]|uniref:Penicillin-binding protein 1A n=1 Tax=Terrisporobacter mayombei TaxID=1541 RepID=A0ABY9Q3Z2_9FIRM|nr:transglycosylase domain-containing protein [Terrisporobacter mayombei]MCC3869382.1 transglycosylase domain-containing protein [Terrisporobacter mayombei]WMT82213.1 Biosynthetic peptidoglycan transglycosylase [Terrisporobacter mayombei]